MGKPISVIIVSGVITTTRTCGTGQENNQAEKIKEYENFVGALQNFLLTCDIGVEIEHSPYEAAKALRKKHRADAIIFISRAMKMQAIEAAMDFPGLKVAVYSGNMDELSNDGPIFYISKHLKDPYGPLLDHLRKR